MQTMKMKARLKYLRTEIGAWFGIVEGLVSLSSVYLFLKAHYWWAFALAVLVVLSLAYVAAKYYFKGRKLNRVYEQFLYLREMMAQIRKTYSVSNLGEVSQNKEALDAATTSLIRMAVNESAKAVSRIVQHECVGVFFIPDSENILFKPKVWSHNAVSKRVDSKLELKISDSIAGQVFSSGVTRVCNDYSKEPDFSRKAQKNWSDLYKSGINVAVEKDGKRIGVLAVDSRETDIFDAETAWIVEFSGDIIGTASQVEKFMLNRDSSGHT